MRKPPKKRADFLVAIGVALLATPIALAQTDVPRRVPTLYRISLISLVGSSAADAATSWGLYEQNRLLANRNDRFHVRGLSIKIGLTTGFLTSERAILRSHPRHRKFYTALNFALTGFYAGAAIHNTRIRR